MCGCQYNPPNQKIRFLTYSPLLVYHNRGHGVEDLRKANYSSIGSDLMSLINNNTINMFIYFFCQLD